MMLDNHRSRTSLGKKFAGESNHIIFTFFRTEKDKFLFFTLSFKKKKKNSNINKHIFLNQKAFAEGFWRYYVFCYLTSGRSQRDPPSCVLRNHRQQPQSTDSIGRDRKRREERWGGRENGVDREKGEGRGGRSLRTSALLGRGFLPGTKVCVHAAPSV